MARINISLDVKSIKNAINQLKQLNKTIDDVIIPKFLDKCLDKIIELANQNVINISGLSAEVKYNIISPFAWKKEVDGKNAKLVNDSEKAVFIEFGVGVVGEQNSHPNTNEAEYRYNIPTIAKMYDGSWIFKEDKNIGSDIISNYVINYGEVGGTKWVQTQGQPAQLFLYNAFMDMISQGHFQAIWKEVVEKVFKGEKV